MSVIAPKFDISPIELSLSILIFGCIRAAWFTDGEKNGNI